MPPPIKTNESDLFGQATVILGEAGIRIVGTQAMKFTRENLAALMSRHLAPNDEAFRARVAAFLLSEPGEAIVRMLLAGGLHAAPSESPFVAKLAHEMVVSATAVAGDSVADLIMEPVRRATTNALHGSTMPTVRPALGEPTVSVVEEEKEKETVGRG